MSRITTTEPKFCLPASTLRPPYFDCQIQAICPDSFGPGESLSRFSSLFLYQPFEPYSVPRPIGKFLGWPT